MDQPQPIKRGRGRPAKPPGEVKRAYFQTRLRDALKQRLGESAREHGKSLSEEIEERLEDSYRAIESAFGGRQGLNAAILLFAAFRFAGDRCAADSGHPEWSIREWLADPKCFEHALTHLFRSVWEHHPGPATSADYFRVLDWMCDHRRGFFG